jgi:L-fuculose-phosphate aldolase
MHLLFYRMRPGAQAICHAHPPTATGFAVADRALDHVLLPEVIIGLGQIPLVHYATPGTPELSTAIEPFVPHYDALLLSRGRKGDANKAEVLPIVGLNRWEAWMKLTR